MTKKEIKLLDSELSIKQIEEFVSNPESGGICIFVGTVRNNTQGKRVTHLEFEAFAPMAIKEMEKIADHMAEQWPANKIAIHHRAGHLEIGETAVLIGVSCPHRKEAFEACSYAIDTLKLTVPIWKKEVFEDGEIWVGSHP